VKIYADASSNNEGSPSDLKYAFKRPHGQSLGLREVPGTAGPCATIPVQMAWQHISDEDLGRYHLGMVTDESELAPLEEHLLGCPRCVERAEEAATYVDTLRATMITGNFDLD
jgi:hypothetical protein